MKIIDARSGQEVAVGQTVAYPDTESLTLLAVEPGILSGRAHVRMVFRDFTHVFNRQDPPDVIDIAALPLVTREDWVPLVVRWTHPRYFLQHVAFLPS